VVGVAPWLKAVPEEVAAVGIEVEVVLVAVAVVVVVGNTVVVVAAAAGVEGAALRCWCCLDPWQATVREMASPHIRLLAP
jgi:hypothetical protein